MTKIENRSFSGEVVNLDGNEFVNCTFEGCTLVYCGGRLPKLSGNSIDNCTWNFSDAAEMTLRFIGGLYQSGDGGKNVVEKMFDQIRSGSFRRADPNIPPAEGQA